MDTPGADRLDIMTNGKVDPKPDLGWEAIMINLHECAKTLQEYLTENKIHGAACHGSAPEITVDSTPWGMLGVIIKCRNCRNEVAAPGDNVIEAFNNAISRWNKKIARGYLSHW